MSDAPPMVECWINGRWPLMLPAARAARPQWPWWEAGRLAALHHFTKAGDVCLYIGGEAGDMPCLLSSWGLQTIVVEPNWKAWPSIRATYEANDLMPYACFDGFASDETPETFMVHQGAWPASAFGDYTAAHDFRTLAEYPDLARARGDDIVAGLVSTVDLISLDVEGAEGVVLLGCSRLMSEVRPYVMLSLHRDEWLAVYGDSEASIRQLVAEADYEWVPISADPHESHILLVAAERFWGW